MAKWLLKEPKDFTTSIDPATGEEAPTPEPWVEDAETIGAEDYDDDGDDGLSDFEGILKSNENHDAHGRFAAAGGSTSPVATPAKMTRTQAQAHLKQALRSARIRGEARRP